MPAAVQYLDKPNIIEIVYDGVISPQELIDAAKDAIRESKDHGSKLILADCTRLEGGHSIADLLDLILLFRELGIDRSYREAIVLPSLAHQLGNVEFFETACLNRGYNVRLFGTREAGMGWLGEFLG